MTPILALEIACELQRQRIAKQLASAAPTRLSTLPESCQTTSSGRRRITSEGMDHAAQQAVYRQRYRARRKALRAALQGRRKRAA